MLLLLPPSEGKTAPNSGKPLNWDELSYPQLNPLRQKIAIVLAEVSQRADALDVLKVGASVEEIVRAQEKLTQLPCAPARNVYTGVLYHALDWLDMPADRRRFAQNHVLIFSALFGVLRPDDPIPHYRLSMGTTLPKIGNTKTAWRKELKDFEPGAHKLVIDCRSGNYQVWNPQHDADYVTIHAVRQSGERRQVISHDAKRFRGMLGKYLLSSKTTLRTAHELEEYAQVLVTDGIVDAIELTAESHNKYKITLVEHDDAR
ncbi:YaaA family protein [Arcanobacterium bovis]|uniref:YaaA family protein n=1 Tax=Arcanobacterium bovis TaxID=2529275 RepID=UPI0013F16857|nr:peroxide stress protein YaaA [Arcanobacterium bovis]